MNAEFPAECYRVGLQGFKDRQKWLDWHKCVIHKTVALECDTAEFHYDVEWPSRYFLLLISYIPSRGKRLKGWRSLVKFVCRRRLREPLRPSDCRQPWRTSCQSNRSDLLSPWPDTGKAWFVWNFNYYLSWWVFDYLKWIPLPGLWENSTLCQTVCSHLASQACALHTRECEQLLSEVEEDRPPSVSWLELDTACVNPKAPPSALSTCNFQKS